MVFILSQLVTAKLVTFCRAQFYTLKRSQVAGGRQAEWQNSVASGTNARNFPNRFPVHLNRG